MRYLRQIFPAAAMLILLSVSEALACPNCKEAFDEGSKQAGVGDMYSYSVIFMLGMPILVLGIVSFKIYSNFQKQKIKNY